MAARILLISTAALAAHAISINLPTEVATNSTVSAVASDCTRCKVHNCCSGGLKCKSDGHDGACVECNGEYETPCGDQCCLSGQECHGGLNNGYSCDIP